MRVRFCGAGLGQCEGAGHELGYIANRAGDVRSTGGGIAKSATVGSGPWVRALGTAGQSAPTWCAGCLLEAARDRKTAV